MNVVVAVKSMLRRARMWRPAGRPSRDGVIVSVTHPDVLAVSLANPANNFVKTVVVKVAHVTPVPGGYLVGGAFTTPPLTYQELTALVM